MKLKSKKTIEIFQKYFTDESHRYRMSVDDGLPENFVSLSQSVAERTRVVAEFEAYAVRKANETSEIFLALMI